MPKKVETRYEMLTTDFNRRKQIIDKYGQKLQELSSQLSEALRSANLSMGPKDEYAKIYYEYELSKASLQRMMEIELSELEDAQTS